MIYLGTINNAGSDVVNNLNTSTPFPIPSNVAGLRLQPSAGTMMAAVEFVSDTTFAPASTAMLQLGAATSVNDLPLVGSTSLRQLPPVPFTLAVRKTDAGSGTTKVFAIAI